MFFMAFHDGRGSGKFVRPEDQLHGWTHMVEAKNSA